MPRGVRKAKQGADLTLNRPFSSLPLLHMRVPGRARVAIPGLLGQPAKALAFEAVCKSLPGIRRVEARAISGHAIIHFDRSITHETIAARLANAWASHGEKVDSPIAPPARMPVQPISPLAPAFPGGSGWHTLALETISRELAVSPSIGLSSNEARARLRTCGRNVLPRDPGRSELAILFTQFQSLPVALLLGSAAISFATGGAADAAITLAVVAVNGAIGFVTERSAERTIHALADPGMHTALVRRDGAERTVPADEVVPGDLIVLQPGSFVPADARVVYSHGLAVDESSLTGESVPMQKGSATLPSAAIALADRDNMLFMGTVVTGGSGEAIVVATGLATEIGQIQTLAGAAERPVTPVERQLDTLGQQMVMFCGAACAGIYAIGLMRGQSQLSMLKSAIALAVAAIPEGLPAIATTTLALGVTGMRRQGVLIRRLEAIETLGALEVICFDKTGTLTENRMEAVAVHVDGRTYDVSDGKVEALQESLHVTRPIRHLLEVSALCNEASVDDAAGSETERALMRLAARAGIDVVHLRGQRPVRRTIYRDERRKLMTTLHDRHDTGGMMLAVKGSPDDVLGRCVSIEDGAVRPITDADRQSILDANTQLAARGFRVLGFAYHYQGADIDHPDHALIWLGLVGLADPIRPGMRELMGTFHRAGMRTVMITGDQVETARAVAGALDLSRGEPLKVLDAVSLASMSADELAQAVIGTHAFARVSPADKLKIVEALQRGGHAVGMTGDGVNDGPALKKADLGIAMGKNGSDVARSIADIVLEDDNLATLANGIARGRSIYANIRKSLHFLLATNLSELFVMAAEAVHGPNELETPMELFWLNLVTDVLPGLGLALLPPDPDILNQAPREAAAPILSRGDFTTLGIEASVIGVSVLGAHAYGLARYGPGPQTRGVTLMSLVGAQLLYGFACRSDLSGSAPAPGIFSSNRLNAAIGASMALQAIPLLVPPAQRLLGIAPLRATDFGVAAVASLIPFSINELARRVRRAPSRPLG